MNSALGKGRAFNPLQSRSCTALIVFILQINASQAILPIGAKPELGPGDSLKLEPNQAPAGNLSAPLAGPKSSKIFAIQGLTPPEASHRHTAKIRTGVNHG